MRRFSSGLRGKHSIASSFWVLKFWLHSLSRSLVQLSLLQGTSPKGLLHSRPSEKASGFQLTFKSWCFPWSGLRCDQGAWKAYLQALFSLLCTSVQAITKTQMVESSQSLCMEAPGWPAHQQFPTCIPPPPLKKKVNKKQEAECQSVCVYSPSSACGLRGAFLFFSFSQHLNLEKSNLEILSKVKMSSICFRASCSLGSDSMCCSGDGWQQHGKLTVYRTGEKSRPSKEKERQASHYPRRQPRSPEGRKLEQVLLCAMGIETVLPSLWNFMY